MKLLCTYTIPESYQLQNCINLQQNTKVSVKLAVGNVWIFASTFAIGFLTTVIEKCASIPSGRQVLVAVLGFFLTVPLHEFVHAVAMKCLKAQKITFRITLQYVSAGCSDTWFTPSGYRLMALTPVLLLTPIIAVLAMATLNTWFWVFWIMLASNLSGSIADIYVVSRLGRLPEDAWIQDNGHEITVFTRRE